MISEVPAWTVPLPVEGREQYERHNFRLVLAHDAVVGAWFCLNLKDGTQRWGRSQKDFGDANHVFGVFKEWVVAETSTCPDAHWEHSGIYGISLQDGAPVWPANPRMFGSRLIQLFRNRKIVNLSSEGVLCEDGGLFAYEDGKCAGQRVVTQEKQTEWRAAWELLTIQGFVYVKEFGRLRHGTPQAPCPPGLAFESLPESFFWEDNSGQWKWVFHPRLEGIDSVIGYLPWGLTYPDLYFCARERKPKRLGLQIDTSIQTLDLRSGTLTQKVPISLVPAESSRIEAINSAGIIASYRQGDDVFLTFFPRSIEA